LEIWPRRGGIAERCNAEGRNRRKAKPNAKHTAPPAREPYPAKTRSGNFRRRLRRIRHSPKREWWLFYEVGEFRLLPELKRRGAETMVKNTLPRRGAVTGEDA
jgi:hypothetical protein